MATIDDLLLTLHAPWSSSAKAILWDGLDGLHWDNIPQQTYGFLMVDEISEGRLTGPLMTFKPFEGLVVNQPMFPISIHLGFSNCWFCKGMTVGFNKMKILSKQPVVLAPDQDCSVWCIPEFASGASMTFLNLFSGGFAGWERAMAWLDQQGIASVFRSTSVDFEPQVMEIWKLQTGNQVLQRPVPVDIDLKNISTGILTCVSDPTILNMWRSGYNGFFTCSPPCQSWSKGGKGSGLESKNGLSFIKSINVACKARPLAVLVECSDLVPKHHHFHLLKACFAFAGYRLVFSTILKLEDLTPMARSRWFAIWCRGDIKTDVPKSVAVSDPCKLGWDHPVYRFFHPGQLAQMLVVSAELTEFYGDFKFLPLGMRGLCSNPDEPYAVLLSRCIQRHENIPTLCASYGSQHLLDSLHLERKGIFAPLFFSEDAFRFVDPFRCAALLGATPHFGTAISCNLVDAWANLGNSVAVPQALHTIVVLLRSLGLCKLPIAEVVMQCWNDRFKADSTIVGIRDCCYWLLIPQQLPAFFSGDVIPGCKDCKGPFQCEPIKCVVMSNTSFRQLFLTKGFHDPQMQGLSLIQGSSKIEWDCSVDPFHGLTFDCVYKDASSFSFTIEVVVPQTLPWTFEEDINDSTFLEAVRKAESETADSQHAAKKARSSESCDRLHPLDPKSIRITTAIQQGVPVGDDEFQFFIDTLARESNRIEFLSPFVSAQAPRFPSLVCSICDLIDGKVDLICLPVLINQHWCGIEFRMQQQSIAVTFLNVRQCDRKAISVISSKLCTQSSRPLCFANAVLPVPDGWCGWALINRWVKFSKCTLFDASPSFSSPKLKASLGDPSKIAPNLMWLAYSARLHFIQQIELPIHIDAICFGHADVDDDMQDGKSTEVDPWLKTDPWSSKRNCKWEDLKLPSDHPIHDAKGYRLTQHHRHQLGTNLGGVAFITKSMIPEVVAQHPKKPFALLLPASDKLVIDPSFQLTASGPFEVVVEDPSSGNIYKRQVMLAQVGAGILFKREKPTYSATLTEMSEIVLEIDARLAQKDTIVAFQEKPLEAFKAKVVEQFPSKSTKNLNVYGFKHFRENSKRDQTEFFQAMCKIPTSDRKQFLERSGIGEICARDFVPKGDVVSDSTIIPRFWQCDKSGKEEAVRAAASLKGFGGLITTKRGIAVRAWVDQIGSIRSILMPHDERICDLNRNIVPVVMRESTGWPSSISASEVVKATLHATSLAPVPTRCFRSLGLTTWTLGFASAPTTKTFLAQFNDHTYEILITEPSESIAIKAKPGKGKGKGKPFKNVVNTQAPAHQDTPDLVLTDRVACLEAKFGSLERRQDQLEHRITTGFDGVQDQLRQVLQAVAPKQSQQATGMTPPPKVAKTS